MERYGMIDKWVMFHCQVGLEAEMFFSEYTATAKR